MCLHDRLDRRSRRILALGNLCLFTGLSLWRYSADFARQHDAIFNGLSFGLFSLAIALNFWAMRSAGRGNKGRT